MKLTVFAVPVVVSFVLVVAIFVIIFFVVLVVFVVFVGIVFFAVFVVFVFIAVLWVALIIDIVDCESAQRPSPETVDGRNFASSKVSRPHDPEAEAIFVHPPAPPISMLK